RAPDHAADRGCTWLSSTKRAPPRQQTIRVSSSSPARDQGRHVRYGAILNGSTLPTGGTTTGLKTVAAGSSQVMVPKPMPTTTFGFWVASTTSSIFQDTGCPPSKSNLLWSHTQTSSKPA